MSGKGAVKHDDRLDCLAQGVKYFTDALSISAEKAIKDKKRLEWEAMLEDFIDHPRDSANHLVFAMNRDQIHKSKGINSGKEVPTWV